MKSLFSFLKTLKDRRGNSSVVYLLGLIATLLIGGIVFSQFAHVVNPALLGASATDTVTVNSTASLGPYQLSHYPVVPGTLTISIGSTVYQQGTDYTVDYANGTFTVVAGSSLATATATATPVTATYKYEGGAAWNSFVNIQTTGWSALNLFMVAAIVIAAGFILALLAAWGRVGGGGSGI